MSEAEERLVTAAKGETDPPDDLQKRENTMQEGIQLLIRLVRVLLNSTVTELGVSPEKASSLVMSMLATNLMIYVRGYPAEAWALAFRELGEYFTRLAMEVEVKEGEANDNNTIGD